MLLSRFKSAIAVAALTFPTFAEAQNPPVPSAQPLPQAGQVMVDVKRSEVILHAVVRHPVDKPCIDNFGQRIQAFVGCSQADGKSASMADFFVFRVDVPTERVNDALVHLGARPRVSYSMVEGHRRSGLNDATKPENYLQGDPVTLTIGWRDDKGNWIEKPYQDFVIEQITVDGKQLEKPWTPSFVYHGSGAIFHSGTGCIACPCDCAGGIIADNRFPLYDPKPTVKFDTSKAPPPGTETFIRIHVACSGQPTADAHDGELLSDMSPVPAAR